MTKSVWMIGAMATAAVLLMGASAQASPLPGAQAAGITNEQSAVETIAYRRCWKHNGVRRCRLIGEPVGRSSAGGYPVNALPMGPPERYRVGSDRWWKAMDRDFRGGHGVP